MSGQISAPARPAANPGFSRERTDEILAGIYARGDRLMGWFLLLHMGLALCLAPIYGTWSLTLAVGACALAMFFIARLVQPGRFLTRCIAGIALQTFVALHIYQFHGLAEMHFFFFSGFTMMIAYQDWRCMWPGTLLIIAQHTLFAILHNSGVRVEFFEDSYISAMKLCFHFGIALAHVGICGWWAANLRRNTLWEAARREQLIRAGEQLEATRRAAEDASRAKSEFLANMSHEIRTPMTAILGYADLMLDPQQSAEDRAASLRTVRANGEHLLAVINDILDLSKIESGNMTAEFIPCSPDHILDEVVTLIEPRAHQKGLDLQVVREGPIPPAISTDPTRLRQILVNLVGNAIKFTDHGEVRITVRSAPDDHQPRLEFEVSDTGIGLTEEQVARLFRPFTQADQTTTRRFGGTGLGLTISRRLAVMLGGDISVNCRINGGCAFTVSIAAPVPVGTLPESARSQPQPASGHPIRGRILLAEDGPDNARLISFHLHKAGADVEIAENGAIAVQKALGAMHGPAPFGLVLMDMQMPVLDGYTATARLRAAGFAAPVIALTANAMTGDRRRCLDAGCTDYATKPIDRDALLAACARWLRAGPLTAAVAPGEPAYSPPIC
jgi:signal transduction histidine kinase/CheY-like chemotaxis protein